VEQYKQILNAVVQRTLEPDEAISRLALLLKIHPEQVEGIRTQLTLLRDSRALPLATYAKLDVELLQWEKQAKAALNTPIALAERNQWRDAEQWGNGWWDEPALEYHPDQIIKKSFRLQSRLSTNSFGETWEALDLLQDGRKPAERHVAILFLHAEFKRHPQAIRTFVTQFTHFQQRSTVANLCNLYAIGREGSSVFIVMELLSGERLDFIIDKNPSGIPVAEVQIVLSGIARAMRNCLAQSEISLTIHPAQIYYDPLQKMVKVLDIGIDWLIGQCRQESSEYHAEYLHSASEAYSSCEALLNLSSVEPRDYVYTLGCIGYELLAGRHPYSRKSCTEACEKHFVPNVLKSVSNAQWQILAKALAFNREQRPASIEAFLQGLYPKPKTPSALILLGILFMMILGFALSAWGVRQWQINQVRGAILQQDSTAITTLQSWEENQQLRLLGSDSRALALAVAEYYLREHGREALVQLMLYPSRTRAVMLGEPTVQNAIKTYYEAQIEQEVTQDQYAQAEQLLTQLSHSLPHVVDLTERTNLLQNLRKQRLQTLTEKYHACLDDDSTPLQTRTPCLEEAVKGVSKIDPEHPILRDTTMVEKYRLEIEKLLKKGVFDTANTLLADWARLRPETDPKRESLAWLATEYVSIENQIQEDYLVKAQARVDEALSVYPDDQRLRQYAKKIQKIRPERLRALEKKYQGYREQNAFMPDDNGEDLFDVRERIQRIDATYPLLRDAGLHKRYFDKIVELSAKEEEDNFTRLRKLMAVWQTLFDNPAYFQPEDKEQLQWAQNRVSLRYLARSMEYLTQQQPEKAIEYANYALSLDPVDRVREKLQALLQQANAIQNTATLAAPAQAAQEMLTDQAESSPQQPGEQTKE